MKRVISDVFPTDCSPRNTSLNLRIALLYSLPPLVVAISSAHRPSTRRPPRSLMAHVGLMPPRQRPGAAAASCPSTVMKREVLPPKPVSRGPLRKSARRRGWVRRRSAHAPSYLDVAIQTVWVYVRAIWRMLVQWPLEQCYRVTYAVFLSPTSHRIVLRMFMLCALHFTCMGLALLAFGAFYYAWVPKVALSKDVWLQYGEGAPWADVRLDATPSDALVWQKEARQPMFDVDLPYDVSLDLRIPVNRVNVDMGNFMVDMSLRTHDGTVLYESHRPVLLVPDPLFLRWTSRMSRMLWKPVLSEPVAPTQLVRVPLLRRIVPHASPIDSGPAVFRQKGYLASQAHVRIGLTTHQNVILPDQPLPLALHPSVVQIEHATLRFEAYLSGAAYLLYAYPVFSLASFLVVFSSIEFGVAVTIWLVSCAYFSWIA